MIAPLPDARWRSTCFHANRSVGVASSSHQRSIRHRTARGSRSAWAKESIRSFSQTPSVSGPLDATPPCPGSSSKRGTGLLGIGLHLRAAQHSTRPWSTGIHSAPAASATLRRWPFQLDLKRGLTRALCPTASPIRRGIIGFGQIRHQTLTNRAGTDQSAISA